ncbi:hypothetical protein ACUODJ_38430, partial [Escherichia sp. HC-CC]
MCEKLGFVFASQFYLVVVFGISVYAMRKRSTGTFLNEYFL